MSFTKFRGVKRSDLKHKKVFYDVKEPQVIFIQGKRRCLPESEFIYTQNGIVQVNEVDNGLSILGGKIEAKHSFDDEVYDITINENIFRASGEHPLYILKQSGSSKKKSQFQWIMTKDVFSAYKKRAPSNKWYIYAYKAKAFQFNTVSIGKSFAKLMGYLMSDGYFSREQAVKFTNVRTCILEDVINLASQLSAELQFQVKSYQKGNGQDLVLTGKNTAYNNPLKNKLREFGVIDRTTFGKLQMLQEDELIEFIQGYFNGDGNLDDSRKNTVSITFHVGIQKRQAYELQFMLWRLGILGKVNMQKSGKRGRKQDTWIVRIGERKEVNKLMDILDPMKYPEKFETARNILRTRQVKPWDHFETDDYVLLPINAIKESKIEKVVGWNTRPSHEIISYMGIKTHNSGKDYILEKCVTHSFKNGITSFHGWSARSYENFFYAHNNHCKDKWDFTLEFLGHLSDLKEGISSRWDVMRFMHIYNDEMFDFFLNSFLNEKWVIAKDGMIRLTQRGYDILRDPPLHCNCHEAFPITAFVSRKFTISPTSIENFNKKNYWSFKEYQEAFLKQYEKDVISKEENIWKRLKPPQMQKDILKITYFTPPTPKKMNDFLAQFRSYILSLRSDYRIGVQTPSLLGPEKFKILAAEINYLPDLMTSKDFARPTEDIIGKPEYMWGPREKGYDRLLFAVSELKTIAPTHQMSGETASTDTKRALFDKVSEWRHWKMSLIATYQNPSDLYSNIRYQADYVAFKRSSKNLAGEEYSWLFPDIDKKRKEMYRKYGVTDEMIDMPWTIDKSIHNRVDASYPLLQQLPDNKMIVTDIDNTWYYLTVPELSHHHKDTSESFEDVFKLEITRHDEVTGEVVAISDEVNEDGEKTKKTAKSHQEFMERVDYLYETMQQKMPEIAKQLTPVEEWNSMTDEQKKLTIKKLYNQYTYWKSAQKKRDINKTFG